MANVGNFLSEEFEQGKAYNTINGYRSAISARHPKIDGVQVGQHPDIVRLMMGVFNKRPPIPRYSETWCVDLVLGTIKSLGTDEDMDIKSLTCKLAMLMALTSPCRGSELSKTKISRMTKERGRVVFQLDSVTKTTKPGKSLLKLSFTPFPEVPLLNVVQCLEIYQKRTQTWRITQNQRDFLFLGLIKPHQPVAPCTIARWLVTLMGRAGVDVDKYKAHSTRAASTSKAKAQGLSTELILKRADWSKASTFGRFYHKEIEESDSTLDTYQEKVLK